MRYLLSAAFAVACVASATSAMAVEPAEVGLLECRGASQQFIVGSITNLQCLFRPSAGGRPQPYDAQIRRVGLDIGFNQSTVLAWSVFAPNRPGSGRAQRHLCRPVGERDGRRRRRRQRAVGRLQQHRRASAGERAGPDRSRRCRRRVGDGDARARDAARPPLAAVIVIAADRIQPFECSRRRAHPAAALRLPYARAAGADCG